MIKHNNKNIEELAKVVVEDWDMDTLVIYAEGRIFDHFKKNKSDFKKEWKEKFGKEFKNENNRN